MVALTALAGLVVVLAAARANSARTKLIGARSSLVAARTAIASRDVATGKAQLDRAASLLRRARGDTRSVPMRLLRPVPLLGSPTRALGGAVTAGEHGVAAGRLLQDLVDSFPNNGRTAVDGHDLSAFHSAAVRSSGAIAAARTELVASRKALVGPSGAALPPISAPARQMKAALNDTTLQLDRAEGALSILGDLTAPGADARILVLSQDTLELRPTGGFIGSYGVLHFVHGTVTLEQFASFDSLPPPSPPLAAPADLARSLPRQWDLANANWWPDFPTSAQAARELYRRQGGGEVQGVMALTERLMSRLIGVLGPIKVPGYDTPVVEKGFEDRVVYEVELKQPRDVPAKKFLVLLAEDVFNRLFQLSGDKVPAVARAMGDAAAGGDLQVWFADPARQQVIARTPISGALPSVGHGDFLMVVDANLSASKANADLVRTMTYTAGRTAEGKLVGTLKMVIANNGEASKINPYYHGLMRIYVPKGARLRYSGDYQVDASDARDGPYQVFALRVLVEPKSQINVDVEYDLPSSVVHDGVYHLTWVRQAGTPNDDLTAVVNKHSAQAPPTGRELEMKRSLPRSRFREWWHRNSPW